MRGKAEDIIHAATKVFTQHGYAAATVDEIAACAEVSKRTLYKHFQSKENLFNQIIVITSQQLMSTLDISLERGTTPQKTLLNLAHSYLQLILSPEALEIYRLVISESSRFPELAENFHKNGAARVSGALAKYLGEWHERGVIQVDNPQMAAEQFMGSCVGSLRLRALFNPRAVPAPPELELWVQSAVDRFLHGSNLKALNH